MYRLFAPLFALSLFAAPAAAEDKFYRLRHVETGKVLAVDGDSDEAGARAVLAKEAESEAQQWKVEKDGEFVKIVNRKTGKVLDVEGASGDEGAGVIVWDDKGEDNDNQRWGWAGDGKAKRLKSKSSGHVLDVGEEGKLVQKKADDAAKGQTWELVEVKK